MVLAKLLEDDALPLGGFSPARGEAMARRGDGEGWMLSRGGPFFPLARCGPARSLRKKGSRDPSNVVICPEAFVYSPFLSWSLRAHHSSVLQDASSADELGAKTGLANS